ncbi:MAG: PAS domain S-box protein [Desulfobacteraceae bacterium]|nr:MAG: PAS domain S-box protein [Desulfobacteraceae bacterium]
MKYRLQDLIDIDHFQTLQDRLNEIYSFPSSIIDNEGNILTATAWQDICTDFHRKNKECEKACIESDRYILSHLHEANPAVSYRCPHGLVDNATPIIIDGVHYGNFFTGQFFLEKPDLEFFRERAKRYGFNEEAYLEAVRKVPIWTKEQLNSYLFFIKGLIAVIAESGLKKLKEIEARKKIEESEERSNTILRRMREGFWVANKEGGQIVDVNEAMCRMLGYTRDEMLHMSVADVEANDTPEVIAIRIQEIMKSGSALFESRFRRKDGTVLDVEVSITYLPNQELLFGFHRDITGRRRVEEKLRDQEKVLSDILEDTLSGYWDWNIQEKTEYLSPAFKKMFGYQDHELSNEPETWQKLIFQEDLPSVLKTFQRHVESHGREPYYNQVRYHHKDGSTVWVICAGRVIEWADDGSPIRMVGCHVDITERRKAEESLRESETIFSAFLEHCPIFVFFKDRNIRALRLSRNYEQMLRMPLEQALGKTMDELFPSDLSKSMIADDLRVLKEGRRVVVVEELGGRVYETTKFPILKDGIPFMLAGFTVDITERKRNEKEREELQVQLASAVEMARLGPWEYDVDKDLFTFNDHFYKIFRTTAKEVGGYTMSSAEYAKRFVHPDDIAVVAEEVRNSIKATDPNLRQKVEHRILYSDGKVGYLDVNIFLVKDSVGRTIKTYGINQDITERKLAELALENLLSRQDALLAAIPDIIMEVDVRKVYTWANQAGFEFFGEDVIGREASYYFEGEQETYGLVKPLFNGHDDVIYLESWQRRKDGEIRLLAWWCRVLKDEVGNVTGALSSARDITERKRAEEEKEKLQAQLLQAQKMESVGRLAGGVAHDFNNMLGIIIGNAEMAAMQVDPYGPVHLGLQEILKAGHRSADTVRQLLAFARKQTIAPKVLDLNDTVEGMLKMLRRLVGEDIDLQWEPGKHLSKVKIDPSQINQILANLVVNARDAISGVGKIMIETSNAVFNEDYCKEHKGFFPGQYVLLAVSDTGSGMSGEVMEHIFDPFFTTKEVGKGTGLGLPMVYGVMKQNNGFINVYSELGHGTTFRLYFPNCEGEGLVNQEKAGAAIPEGTETVLIAEDELPLLNIARTILTNQGYTVLAARTPTEALSLAREHKGKIHLLVTDVVMPEMNGRALSETLHVDHPGMKSLFMSGYTADVVAHHGVLDEGVDFIEKPFSPSALAKRVREVLDRPKS